MKKVLSVLTNSSIVILILFFMSVVLLVTSYAVNSISGTGGVRDRIIPASNMDESVYLNTDFNAVDKRKILYKANKIQLPFIENQGQIEHDNVRFYSQTFGGTLFVTSHGEIVYSLPKYDKEVNEGSANKKKRFTRKDDVFSFKVKDSRNSGWVIKERFAGATIREVKGEGKVLTKVNYFHGNDPSKWQRGISTYKQLNLGAIYNGIELKLMAFGNNVEKLFYVKPGANPKNIKIIIDGTKEIKVNESGELEIETGLGAIKFTKPVAYQKKDGKKKYIQVAYTLEKDEYGFKLGEYDNKAELVIDPLLASTFLGGTNTDYAWSVTQDASGNVFIGGYSDSTDFPATAGAYMQSYRGNKDAFVAKLDNNLQNLLASTFIGGSDNEGIYPDGTVADIPIVIDSLGNVFIAGLTSSSDFPTTSGAYDETYNGGSGDGFVSKLDNNLQNLIASTFIGGSGNDEEWVHDISLDNIGDLYVAGETSSSDFPTTSGAYDETYNGGGDGFVSRLDSNLQNLLASTFIGGSSGDDDEANAIVVDGAGNVYVAGETGSSDFPTTPGAYDTSYNDTACRSNCEDGFVSKFNGDLQSLLASTFLGGTIYDYVNSLVLGNNGNIFVGGITASSDFPVTPGAYDMFLHGPVDAFVSKLDAKLANLLSSTYLGGSDLEGAGTSLVIFNNEVILAGSTWSADFPTTPGAYNRIHNGYIDGYVSKLDSNLQNLIISTLGAPAGSITIDKSGFIYIGGIGGTDSPTIPGSYDTTFNGGVWDAIVSKFDKELSAISSELFNPNDTNSDWMIGDFELLAAIDTWATGLIGDFELLAVIDFWAAGCYHWDASAGVYKAGCEETTYNIAGYFPLGQGDT